MILSTGTYPQNLPTGTIDSLSAIIVLTKGLPSSPEDIQVPLQQLHVAFQPSGTYGSMQMCKASRATNFSVDHATDTQIPLTQDDWDLNNMHSITGSSTDLSKIFIKETNWYLVTGYAVYEANATSIRSTQIWMNGGALLINTQNAPSGGQAQVSLSDVFYLPSGTYLQLSVYQASGIALNVNPASLSVTPMRTP